MTIICAYAPTLTSDEHSKDQCCLLCDMQVIRPVKRYCLTSTRNLLFGLSLRRLYWLNIRWNDLWWQRQQDHSCHCQFVHCLDRSCRWLARDCGLCCCLWSGVSLWASDVDKQSTWARIQTSVCRLRQLQATTDCWSHQRQLQPPSTAVCLTNDCRVLNFSKVLILRQLLSALIMCKVEWSYLYVSLEASSGPPKQPMDRPGPQGQLQHTTSWFVEAIHRARSFGGDATVLVDYALTMTTTTNEARCQSWSSWSDATALDG